MDEGSSWRFYRFGLLVTGASLRVLFAWCGQGLGQPVSARYQLEAGCYDRVTGPQLKQ